MDPGSLTTNLRGVIMDAVGTLIEATPSVTQAYVTAAARQGIALDPRVVRDRFRRAFGSDETREGQGPLSTDEPNESRRWRRIVGEVIPEVPDLDRGFRELWDHFGRPDAWRCFPDVPRFLLLLRSSGLPVRIASNFDRRLRAVVEGLPELAGLADSLVISSEVGRRKPHPEFYRSALDSLGVSPEKTLWIGDDLENDVLGPRGVGIRSVFLDRKGVEWGGGPSYPDLGALADALFAG